MKSLRSLLSLVAIITVLTPGMLIAGYYETEFSDYIACNKNKDEFNVYGLSHSEEADDLVGRGTFNVTGTVVASEEETMGPSTTVRLRLKIQQSYNAVALNYFKKTATSPEDYGINTIKDDVLYFSLGEFSLNRGTFQSTAKMSKKVKTMILKSALVGSTIKLKLTVPFYPDMGVPSSFSYACKIQ